LYGNYHAIMTIASKPTVGLVGIGKLLE